MKFSIRRRLLAVAGLGLVTCVFALYALGRPLAFAGRRAEQARFGIEQEVGRLLTADRTAIARPQARMAGMRSGSISATASFDAMQPPLDPEIRALLERARSAALSTGVLATREATRRDSTLFVAVAPGPTGRFVWASYLLYPPRWPLMRVVGLALAITSIVLVITSLHAVGRVHRDAQSLQRSLRTISADLDAKIPRPTVSELGDVADGIANLARDLSAADRERERLRGELAEGERLAVLGRVTAGVAHELRNPLALIKLRVDLAVRAASDPAAVVRELADVPSEIARLDRLVKDLLTVAGRRTGPRSEVDLAELARRRAEVMAPMTVERGVRFQVTGSARATVDPDAIAQVLDNLQRNASEASPPDGVVVVDVRSEGGRAIVRVIDEGPGLPAGRETELFEPFFTTKPEGVGLGLAVSRALAVAHRGSLGYQRDGARSIFELIVPIDGEAAS